MINLLQVQAIRFP